MIHGLFLSVGTDDRIQENVNQSLYKSLIKDIFVVKIPLNVLLFLQKVLKCQFISLHSTLNNFPFRFLVFTD